MQSSTADFRSSGFLVQARRISPHVPVNHVGGNE